MTSNVLTEQQFNKTYLLINFQMCAIVGVRPLQAVFHGHIHKKQVKDVGGRKAQERTWRPLYAAIHGHQLVFYKDFKDAFSVSHIVATSTHTHSL